VITRVENACRKGAAFIYAHNINERRNPPCLVKGERGDLTEALDTATQLLRQAKKPLIFGLDNSTLEAQARAIELSRTFEEKDFDKFDRQRMPNVYFAGLMQYDGDLLIPKNYLVFPPEIERTISAYLCAEKVKSFAISETQKFGHVTYFWNGNRSGYIDKSLETYIEIPSDKIEFDKAPKMKAYEITDKTIELLRSGEFKFGRVNFPNGDMVGHTGIMEAAIIAVETTDECVGRLLKVIDELDGIALITADHGNADEMYTEKNGVRTPKTSHTLNPVPFVIYDPGYKNDYEMDEIKNPGLTNIASTILNLLGYKKVEDYDESLISINQ